MVGMDAVGACDLYPSGDEDEYGEWRPVPGTSHTRFKVSNMGFVSSSLGSHKASNPFQPKPSRKGYRRLRWTSDDGAIHNIGVHVLVCRAFHGPRPSCRHTPDHINGNPADNRSCNLRWSTPAQQIHNQTARRAKRTGRRIKVRKVGDEEWTIYESATRAAADTGTSQANLGKVANGKIAHSNGYHAAWVHEPETDLDLPGEEWQLLTENQIISTMGRIQTRYSNSTYWSPKTLPSFRDNEPYSYVGIGERKYIGVHVAVFTTFVRALQDGETVDHINRNTHDNRLLNLRAATAQEQRQNQSRDYFLS